MLVFLVGYPGGGSITGPSGFTTIDFAGQVSGFYKVATASEPATYTFTIGASSTLVGWLGAYVGVDTTSPVDPSTTGTTASGTSHTTTAITTTSAYDMIVAAFKLNVSGVTWTAPADMLEITEVGNTTGGTPMTMGVDYTFQGGAGSTGTKIATSSLSGSAAYLIFGLRQLASNTTTLGSTTVSAVSPSGPTLVPTSTFATSAAAFADSDHLLLDVSVPNDAANCAVRVSFDSTGQPSKLTSATIVPEALLGLLLLGPAIPLALRHRRRTRAAKSPRRPFA